MSAWEGSEWQARQEMARLAREELIKRTQRDNPSLTWEEAKTWALKQEAEAAARVRPRCCPCQAPGRAELVARGRDVVRCMCACHGRAQP